MIREAEAATLNRRRLGMTLMLIFGVLALVLAAIGISSCAFESPSSSQAHPPFVSPSPT